MRLHAHSENLLEQFNQRNERAFEHIFQRYWPVVFSLAYDMIGDSAEAQDITQEVFVKLWQSTNKEFPEFSDLKRFLLFITRNATIDVIRKQKRTSL
jgi:RNA polymerase sigma-70 factor (ECF subfamily)